MAETAEGIGGRKWSLLRDAEGYICLQQGRHELARLTERDDATPNADPFGSDVKELLVTAPQLWDAANNYIKTLHAPETPDAETLAGIALMRLQAMVAKAVGKMDWDDVKQ